MDTESIIQRLNYLESKIRQLEQVSQLDPQILRTITLSIQSGSSKTAASATKTIDEGGSSTHEVMYPPDGFIRIGDYNVPYIN